jgi:8-oxo-dGTP pyrophosphatase MutT (NUDIX family)
MPKLLKQFAALPVMEISGVPHVLLITSRSSQRWIIPKGQPEKKLHPNAVAALEALEEAGVTGTIGKQPLGRYRSEKCLASGKLVPVEVTVFRLDVLEHLEQWKEQLERRILWIPLSQASDLADDGGLSAFLVELDLKAMPKDKKNERKHAPVES